MLTLMKNSILILTLFFINNYTFGQQNKWPYSDFAYSRAFMYNLENEFTINYSIIQDEKINNSATSVGEKLSKDQEKLVLDIINSNIRGLNEGLSKTFLPHHAIVFFDKNDVPLASIMFSFDGEGIRLQPLKKDAKIVKELTDKEINDQLNKLAQFRKVVESLGFPVFDSPFEYQKQNPMRTRSLEMPRLKLKDNYSVKQLVSDDDRRFDLSGIVSVNGKILAIADKEWNDFIYQIDTTGSGFKISEFKNLCTNVSHDIEGVEYSNSAFYIIDEFGSEVYAIENGSCEMKLLNIPWKDYGVDRSDWGNKGFEGIAIDCKNNILYLAKEREDRRLFRIDLKTMKITEPFKRQLAEGGGNDISDLKFENGNLYLLERNLGQVTRIDCTTGEKLSFSFKDSEFKNGQRMFSNSNPQFGMAEALLLTSDEIWIGYDNNGDPVSEYGKSIGLKEGNKAAILIFKRPKGF